MANIKQEQLPVTGCLPFPHEHRWKQHVYNGWYCRYSGCSEKVVGPGRGGGTGGGTGG